MLSKSRAFQINHPKQNSPSPDLKTQGSNVLAVFSFSLLDVRPVGSRGDSRNVTTLLLLLLMARVDNQLCSRRKLFQVSPFATASRIVLRGLAVQLGRERSCSKCVSDKDTKQSHCNAPRCGKYPCRREISIARHHTKGGSFPHRGWHAHTSLLQGQEQQGKKKSI